MSNITKILMKELEEAKAKPQKFSIKKFWCYEFKHDAQMLSEGQISKLFKRGYRIALCKDPRDEEKIIIIDLQMTTTNNDIFTDYIDGAKEYLEFIEPIGYALPDLNKALNDYLKVSNDMKI